jgi:hypothetical protein
MAKFTAQDMANIIQREQQQVMTDFLDEWLRLTVTASYLAGNRKFLLKQELRDCRHHKFIIEEMTARGFLDVKIIEEEMQRETQYYLTFRLP